MTDTPTLYLGLDVHATTTVWALLQNGHPLRRGKTPTTREDLEELVTRLSEEGPMLAGQEVGTLASFVHDVVSGAGVRILSFNAYQLRMLCSSRKKSDRRDSYWLAKALQSGMYPHPVYIPPAPIRHLRGLLAQRETQVQEHSAWISRARAYFRMAGVTKVGSAWHMPSTIRIKLAREEITDPYLVEGLELCRRKILSIRAEKGRLESLLAEATKGNDDIRRLQTIPGFGDVVATAVYAQVGDIRRFGSARALCSYAGLVPSVRQTGHTLHMGAINKQGSPLLRRVLVQAAQVVINRCRSEDAVPLQRTAARIRHRSQRYKIAVVALARHLLRIAYYVLRDGTEYQPQRLTRTN